MPISVVTGVPGSGKTLWTIDTVEKLRAETNRPVFYHGISELTLPWEPLPDPMKWMDCPPESIIVIDEAQKVFRPRANGSQVPPYEEALETHRHGGVDLYLLTQHPRLLSINVRSLTGIHYHIRRKFGMNIATVWKWSEISMTVKNFKDAVESVYVYNRKVFGWYKSAEVHTIKRSIPLRIWLLLAAIPLALGLAWWGISRLMNPSEIVKPPAATASQQQQRSSSGFGPQAGSRGQQPLSPAQYVQQFQPRIPGLPHTAAVYDGVTQPTQAPYPAACIASASRCVCASQQGTKLDMADELCRSIAAGGFFVAWGQPVAKAVSAMPVAPTPATVVMAGPGSLGGSGVGMVARSPGQSPSVGDGAK